MAGGAKGAVGEVGDGAGLETGCELELDCTGCDVAAEAGLNGIGCVVGGGGMDVAALGCDVGGDEVGDATEAPLVGTG